MRGPKPPAIELKDTERLGLEALLRRGTVSQQIAMRARIILAAADGYNNGQIARALHIGLDQARCCQTSFTEAQGVPVEAKSLADCVESNSTCSVSHSKDSVR